MKLLNEMKQDARPNWTASWRAGGVSPRRGTTLAAQCLAREGESRSSSSATAGARGGMRTASHSARKPVRASHTSGRESRKLSGALRSPTFTIEKPYLAIRVAGRDAKARLILNGLQLIMNPIYGGLAQPINHGEELKWMVFDLRMWKGQPAYLELLDDGPGFVAITEAWFADSPPPGERGEKVPLPELAATTNADAKKLVARIRELEAKLPELVARATMRDGTGINEHVFIRGNHKTLGVEAPRGVPRSLRQTGVREQGQRAARTGENRHRPDEPAGRARHRQPPLEAPLRRRDRPLAG